MKHSFFTKNFISSLILILVVFGLAAGTFLYQIDRYAQSEKEYQLSATAESIAELTGYAVQTGDTINVAVLDASLKNTARQDQMNIILADPTGAVLMRVDPDRGSYASGGQIPPSVVQRITRDGIYTESGTLGTLLSGKHYVVGALCEDDSGNALAMVFVAASSERVVGMFQEVTKIFLIIILISLGGALIVSYFLSSRMTRPLKTMANAAREFAAGDFSVRVPEDNRCDEIDELAISFNNMARDLEQLEELTQGFIGNVSHEFKTPMTTISGFVDGMLDGTIPQDQQKKYLHIISEEVKRLSRMTMSMLAAAKIQSGELIISPVLFDFSEMTSQILLSFEQKITAKNIEVEADFADRLMVMGDRDHVFRAVYNLVDNAVKFIDDGGRLRVTAYPAGAFCEFSICNTGGGIPADDIPHIFDRFYKTDRSRSRDRSGAGLGLYIVKNIINLHGGDISVRSDGGETEFSFTLPLAPAAKPPKPTK